MTNPNPVDAIGGLTTSANVPKGDVTAWAKARVAQLLADATEIRNTVLASQLAVYLKATGQIYFLDAADTTTADDGLTCIVSGDGQRFKLPALSFVLDTDATLAANSDARVASQKATKAYVDTKIAPTGSPASPQIAQFTAAKTVQGIPFSQLDSGGTLNKFRNAGMDVDQRLSNATPLTITTSGGYSVDGWIVVPTGASCTAQQVSAGAISSLSKNSLQVKGATSVTDILVKQRIESAVAAPLSGRTVTVQAKIYNNTGGSITPTLTVKHATAADNWGATATDVSAVSLQPCANGATTTVAYTFAASASSINGLEVAIDLGNNFSTTGKTCLLTDFDIRETAGASVGLTSQPPPIELRPSPFELSFCQRYFQYFGGIANYALGIGTINGTTTGYVHVQFFVPMRIAPTIAASSASAITFGAAAGNYATSAISGTLISTQSCFVQGTLTGATVGQAALGLIPLAADKVTASAEL